MNMVAESFSASKRCAGGTTPPMVMVAGTKQQHYQLADNAHVQVPLEEGSLFAVEEPPVDEEAAAERQADIAGILSRFIQHLHHRTQHHLGYPYNLDLDYFRSQSQQMILGQFQQSLCINNLGDPFVESNYGVHSRPFEVAVLDWFARLWDLHHQNDYWGCITSCGTEGNLHGLLLGRDRFPDGIIYASRDSHYSVFKAARMYRVKCVTVDTLVTGEINCQDFRSKLMNNTGNPAIVNVNIGTTVKGAIDDLDRIIKTLEECGFNGRFHIHCDGALAGLMIPFIKQAPKLTFTKPIGSISVSGHKFLGCPVPCGVLISRRQHVLSTSNIEYLSSMDTTIMGSRNGHAPIFMWYTLNKKGYRGIRNDVHKCLQNTQYLAHRLREKTGISAARLNPLSNTVVFERPRDEKFVRKWQLACQGNIAHVLVMPNITKEKLNTFVNELATQRAAWYRQDDNNGEFTSTAVPCIAQDIGHEHCLCSVHYNNMSMKV